MRRFIKQGSLFVPPHFARGPFGPFGNPQIIRPTGGGGGGSTLNNNLVAYWKLDEASGSRADSIGANTLSDNAGVTSAAGKQGNAAQFTRLSSQYLSIADNADLSSGANSFTVAGWFRFDDSTHPVQTIVGKANGSADEYYFWNLLGAFEMHVTAGGNDYKATSTITPADATWYFFVGWYDDALHQVSISVNDETAVNTSTAGNNPTDGAAGFQIGSYAGGAHFMDGRIDEVGFWRRVLTSGERTQLYNSGAGLTTPF